MSIVPVCTVSIAVIFICPVQHLEKRRLGQPFSVTSVFYNNVCKNALIVWPLGRNRSQTQVSSMVRADNSVSVPSWPLKQDDKTPAAARWQSRVAIWSFTLKKRLQKTRTVEKGWLSDVIATVWHSKQNKIWRFVQYQLYGWGAGRSDMCSDGFYAP